MQGKFVATFWIFHRMIVWPTHSSLKQNVQIIGNLPFCSVLVSMACRTASGCEYNNPLAEWMAALKFLGMVVNYTGAKLLSKDLCFIEKKAAAYFLPKEKREMRHRSWLLKINLGYRKANWDFLVHDAKYSKLCVNKTFPNIAFICFILSWCLEFHICLLIIISYPRISGPDSLKYLN